MVSTVGLADEKNKPYTLSKIEKKAEQACRTTTDNSTVLFVVFRSLKDDAGNIRVHVYSDNPEEFLKGGKGFYTDVKTKKKDNSICMKMPGPGRYAIALMHDRNANTKADIFTEGFGFSNNVELGLSKPDHSAVLMSVPEGRTTIVIKMQYVFGSTKEKEERRRRMRRN